MEISVGIGGDLSMISTLHFHSHRPLLLSSGPGSTFRLRYINRITKFPPPPYPSAIPISTTPLRPSGTRVFTSGRRGCFRILSTAAVLEGNPDMRSRRVVEGNGDLRHPPRREINAGWVPVFELEVVS
ncbi:unnamed protein product [Tuber aestivum]|uniref:Uncharacterized protein n=1 Tax=Tuber aestivum TaxID=59557 RepID=A0A292PQV7_9PEZI|nr:unnamed protein product [Tuber aestivum]